MKTGRKLIRSIAVASFSVFGALAASQAGALTTSSTEFVGVVNDGIPSDLASEVVYINDLKDVTAGTSTTCATATTETCDRTLSTLDTSTLDDAVLTGAVKDDTSPSTTIDITGWTWLLAKYDADKAGSLVWYVGDLTGLVTIPLTFGTCGNPDAPSGCGLSHWSLFNPDGGGGGGEAPEPATILLFGSALAGLGLIRRRRRA